MKREVFSTIPAAAALLFAASPAFAHVSIISGAGFADTSQEITFGVGHGCEGNDTWSVRVEIPAAVVSVRAEDSDFGRAAVELDDAELVTAVTWQKSESSLLDLDSNYYKLTVRLRVPNAPFTTLHFPTRQVCRSADGEETLVDWVSTDPVPAAGEEGPEPAPALLILPKRYPGWNKFTIAAPIADVSAFFSDAQIVWKDDAAYSANPYTTELIGETDGVSTLAALEEGDEVWVKY